MAIMRDVAVDAAGASRINALACVIAKLCVGKPKTECETALLSVYCMVADGVQEMPAGTRDRRAGIVVEQGSRALCEIIRQVASIDDAELLRYGSACRE